jgi:NAD(P)H-hydrate epimerase
MDAVMDNQVEDRAQWRVDPPPTAEAGPAGIPWAPAPAPALTAPQMREVDRIMMDEYGIDLVRMMENAGRALAELAITRFAPGHVDVLAGPGGNGGGGLVAARHLANRGIPVAVWLVRADLSGVPAAQARILHAMGVPVTAATPPLVPSPGHSPGRLVIDAILGYSLVGEPSGRSADLIDWAGAQSAAVLALDTPSGLDVSTGVAARRCVRADATLTLALPKVGLLDAAEVGDELYLADISVPPALYRRLGLEVAHLFARSGIVRVPTGHRPHPTAPP